MLEFRGETPTQFGDTSTAGPQDPAEPAEPPITYIQDYSGGEPVDALSRIDETALQTIADQLHVGYLHRSADHPVDAALADIEVGELSVQQGEPDSAVELYWIFVIPFGVLVLLEFFPAGGLITELRGARSRR